MLVIAEQRHRGLFHSIYGILGHVNACGVSTAWASGWNDFVSGIAVSIQILLHMGNDLVSFAYLDTASRHQLQILDEEEVMEACPGYRAAINLHRVKDRHRCNFPRAARRPFNRTQDGFVGIVLKLERQSIFIVMPGPSAGLCIPSHRQRAYPTSQRSGYSLSILYPLPFFKEDLL